jgi:RNAse (barnase) inhibitor barstar
VTDLDGDPEKQDAAWSYMHDDLLPITVVWKTKVSYRKALQRYAADLAENATAIVGRD